MKNHLPIFILSACALAAAGGLGARTVLRSSSRTIERMDQSDFRSDLTQSNLSYLLDGDQAFPAEDISEGAGESLTEKAENADFSGLIELISERSVSYSEAETEAMTALSDEDMSETIYFDEEIIDLESEFAAQVLAETGVSVTESLTEASDGASEASLPASDSYHAEDYPVPADHRVIFVGDSRTIGAGDALVDAEDNCIFIGEEGEGHSYLEERGIPALYDAIASWPDAPVVFNLGVNDCENITLYLDTYEQILADYPDTQFYFMSVNPVTADSRLVTNEDIEAFNRVLRAVYPDRYIDTYTWMTEGGFISTDGVHYAGRQYEAIHDYAVRAIYDLPQPTAGLHEEETSEED